MSGSTINPETSHNPIEKSAWWWIIPEKDVVQPSTRSRFVAIIRGAQVFVRGQQPQRIHFGKEAQGLAVKHAESGENKRELCLPIYIYIYIYIYLYLFIYIYLVI